MPAITCTSCAHVSDSKFCPNCGAKMPEAVVAVVVEVASPDALPGAHVDAAPHRHGTGAPRCQICGGPLLVGGRACANKNHPQTQPQDNAPPAFDPAHARTEIVRAAPPVPVAPPVAARQPRRTHGGSPATEPETVTSHVVVPIEGTSHAEAQAASEGRPASPFPAVFSEFMDPDKIAAMESGPMKSTLELVELVKSEPAARRVFGKLYEVITGQGGK